MNLPTEIKLPTSQLAALMAVVAWYEAMPSETETAFCAGDRFHENVHEYQQSFMPDLEDENAYISFFEIRDGVLYAAVDSDERDTVGDDPYAYIPIVAE